jgi:hypothetical protein
MFRWTQLQLETKNPMLIFMWSYMYKMHKANKHNSKDKSVRYGYIKNMVQ